MRLEKKWLLILGKIYKFLSLGIGISFFLIWIGGEIGFLKDDFVYVLVYIYIYSLFPLMIICYVIIFLLHLVHKQINFAKKDTLYFLISAGIILVPPLILNFLENG